MMNNMTRREEIEMLREKIELLERQLGIDRNYDDDMDDMDDDVYCDDDYEYEQPMSREEMIRLGELEKKLYSAQTRLFVLEGVERIMSS